MSASEDVLLPYTKILRQESPRLRILVVGKSGAGKSALINAVFGVEGATPVSHRTPGVHNIDTPFSYPPNDRIIIHDSQGFEPGEEENIRAVSDFVDRRSKMPALADQLHAIWVCAEIPFAGGRLFEKGVERILLEYRGNLPIIVVFTKLDILREVQGNKLEKQLEQRGQEMDDDQFEAELDTIVALAVQDLCFKPLCALMLSEPPKWVATSTTDPRYKTTIADLVNLSLELTQIDKVWNEMARAQRAVDSFNPTAPTIVNGVLPQSQTPVVTIGIRVRRPLLRFMNDRQAVQFMKKDHDLPLSTKSTKLFLSWLEYPNVGASTKNKILKHIAKKEVSNDDALEVAQSLLIDSEVIHQFLQTSDLQLQTYACDVLINLALKPSSAAVVVQANPCSSLVSLSHGVTPTLTVRALRALYLIANNANGGRAVIQAGALNYLDKLFSSSNMEVWAATCDMLWSLAIVDSTLKSVVRANPSRGLVTVLRGKDARVVHKAATILALIAESEEGAQAVIAAGLLDLLDVVIQLPDQTTICLVVQQLGSHDSTRNSVLTSNLCRHIVSLLRNDANVPHALGALRSIAKLPEPVQAVLDAGILYVLGRLFESTDSKVRREACGLVGDLAIFAIPILDSSIGSAADSSLYRALKAMIPAISQVLQDPDASARSTAVGVLMTLAAHFGFEETTGAIIPRLLSILRWDDDLYVRYTTAVSLDKFLEYPTLRHLLVDDIPCINAQLGRKIQEIEVHEESEPQCDGTESSGDPTPTSISQSTQDSVLRRRGPHSKEEDSEHPFSSDPVPFLYDPCFTIPEGLGDYLRAVSSHLRIGGATPQPSSTSSHTNLCSCLPTPDLSRWFANLGNYLSAAYLFMIAPPFLHDKMVVWDLQRLEQRLSIYQTWVWAANLALVAASAALLPVRGVASSTVAQGFDILGGIFALFGFVYTVFLAFRIGDCKAQSSDRFIDRANSTQGSHSLWNVGIMLSLPLTWMTWAIVSLVCCMLSLGFQYAIWVLRSSGDGAVNSLAPKPLSIFQLSGFMVAVLWSSFYVAMIHVEIRKCTASSGSP